jgi:hypothetical protein
VLAASEDLPVTEKTTPVCVEWALQGKTLGREGSRVLACSSGNLSVENFNELISRFSLGTPDELPQVSVSFLTSGTGPDRIYYFGMAIHKWAADVQTEGGELLERDDDNRPVAITTYFCVPYQPLAAAAISYQAMYQEFNNVRLTTKNGPPLQVEFPVRRVFPAFSPVAMQSASRLLARPVCVLEAESTTMAERLEFIGAVAALLPYGFRTRLTATTWVRSTHRDHRFRLFFSDAKRDSKSPDDLVYWGRPEGTRLTPNDDYAYTYARYLDDTVGQIQTLAGLTKPRSFNRDEVFESLDEIGIYRLQRGKRERDQRDRDREKSDKREPDKQEPDQSERDEPGSQSPVPPKDAKLDGEQILRDCAAHMQGPYLPGLYIGLTHLKSLARSHISPEERRRYQDIIREEHLFRHDVSLGNFGTRLRDALFKIAFIAPFSYEDYCLIEDSLGADFADQELLRMIADRGMSDMRIRAVVYGQLPRKDIRKKLDDWYKSAHVNAEQLISTVVGEWTRPRHAFCASLITADFMNPKPSDRVRTQTHDPAPIRQVLQEHSYLARMLQAEGDGDDTEVYVLTAFLGAAYPDGLIDSDVWQILIESPEPPSQALLAAVLLELARPNDTQLTQLAREAYVLRTTLEMNLDQKTLKTLESRVHYVNGWRTTAARGGNRYPITDQT